MFRQRKYLCQSQTFYQRDQLLNKVLKDSEDNFKGLEQHGRSIQKATKDFFIKFNQSKYQDQKKLVETDSVGVFSMINDLILNVSHDKSLMAYVLPTLDAIISESQKQFKQFMRAVKSDVIDKLKKFIQLDGYESCVYEASTKIATMYIAEENIVGREWVGFLADKLNDRDATGQKKIKISDPMVMPILVHLLKHEHLAEEFMVNDGFRIMQHLLSSYPTDLQVCYYTILGLWLLSYSSKSYVYFADPKYALIKLTIEAIQKISREKVLRVAFATFRNLSDNSPESIELMVDNGLIKIIDLLLKGNLKDQDVIDDIKYVGEILEKNIKILTSYEKYLKELQNQNLSWSPVHSEKFWKENVKRFEENDFLYIRKLSELLTSENLTNIAVACYDLGEFCRFHPFGKAVLDGLNAKTEIMRQARSQDQTVRENALLALQKIMLHNWQVV